ncbi:hypothetical protein [Variovorax atrisoli]|uniref:hypothetical protein n=1 Tax=Variovorax atrisoli TaxID=3394203 RepID=UPI00403FF9A1
MRQQNKTRAWRAMQELKQLFDSTLLMSLLSFVGGALLTKLGLFLRGRVRTLEWAVSHDRLAASVQDPIFGSISVRWQQTEVTNLFMSRIEIRNRTGRDLSNLPVRFWAGDGTMMLNESSTILGGTQAMPWSPDFRQALQVAPGATPSTEQFQLFTIRRDYLLPVLNRGQIAQATYLTTLKNGASGPMLFAEVHQAGLRVKPAPLGPQVLGVRLKVAAWVGLATAAVVVAASIAFVSTVWIAALLSCAVGLSATFIGALLVRGFDAVSRLVIDHG